MSRKGNPYDNALMEAFYKTLKRELINDAQFNDIDQAQMEIFKYIETYYNTKRIHSALGYQSPRDFEKNPLILLTKCLVFLDNSMGSLQNSFRLA